MSNPSAVSYHPLYGKRVLHVLSPVRWSGKTFKHQADSNFKVTKKTIDWLPMCHHYLLVPESNEVEHMGDNVTIVPFPYAGSVLYNRAFFDSKAFLKWYDSTTMDIDFVFLHQPELLYNVEGTLHVSRVAPTLKKFVFFHWVDCPQSKPIEDYPEGFWRQVEAISLADKAYFHGSQSLEYLKSNWKKPKIVGSPIQEELDKKVSYMPLAISPLPKKSAPIPLPKKKILVFNHRWNNTTGISKLISYTKDLNRDEYLVWVTDKDAKKPKAGDPAPAWMKVQNLQSAEEYKHLLENAHATLTFVDGYATWNLSVQDGILLGTPALIYDHPIMDEVIGKKLQIGVQDRDGNTMSSRYPYYFTDKKSFSIALQSIDRVEWSMPDHDVVFKRNLITDMIDNIHVMKQEPKASRDWVHHTLKLGNNAYKKHLLYNTHPNLFASNSWERIRCWLMNNGALDDPNSQYTRMWFPNPEDAKKLIEGMQFEETRLDPTFMINSDKYW